MNCRVSSFTLKEPTLEVVPVAGSRTSMAPALVANLPPPPGITRTSSPTGRHLFGPVNVIGVWPQFLDESGRIDMALPVRQWRDVLAVIAQAVPDIEIGLAVLLLVGHGFFGMGAAQAAGLRGAVRVNDLSLGQKLEG